MSIPFGERGGAARGLLDLATGCYPAFLFGAPLSGLLPVFHFHDVTAAWLEPRLRYLAENAYSTVTCDEIEQFVVHGRSLGPRAVALTFDDAWASLWTVAMPLLRQYGLRAIAFAIPARIRDAPGAFVSWEQLGAMHASGIVDVQSHTRSHAMIFSGETVADFVTPGYARAPLLERPLVDEHGVNGAAVRFLEPDALGTPLHERRSRMSDARRFLPDPAVAERCRQHVAANGGPVFFDRQNWRAELEALAGAGRGAFEDPDRGAAAIREELADGRAALNGRLRSSTVRHVALPWGIAGSITRRALADTGHATAFAERPFRRRAIRTGDDRYGLMRLNSKFLLCLPGRGRKWFFSTV